MNNQISARIDYFRAVTTDVKTIMTISEEFYRHDTTEPTIPLYGYKQSLRELQSGAVFLFNGHHATMGNCSQLGGTAITALMAAKDASSVGVIRDVHVGEWRCTRIDVAIDVFDTRLKPRHVWRQIEDKKAMTVWRSWREVAQMNLDDGHTVYGGGLESEKRIRIYDKSAEQGTKGDWTRYEMVFSGKRADEVWRKLRGLSDDAAVLAAALELLRSLLDFQDWDAWRDVFGEAAKTEWVETPRQESDVWKWLMSQVAPTFRNAWEQDGDWRMLQEFVRRVKND